MNSQFPRILVLLRTERHISQKKAAADLGISQALLSHYEKGIRECGLDFVVRAADYYDVSCDYLLGRSADRTGLTVTAQELPEADGSERGNLQIMLNKKLLINSLHVLFDTLSRTKSHALVKEMSEYLMLAVYRMLRVLHKTDSKNPDAMFAVPEALSAGYSDAAMLRCAANAAAIAAGEAKRLPNLAADEVSPVTVSPTALEEGYPLYAASVLNLVRNAEHCLPLGEQKK